MSSIFDLPFFLFYLAVRGITFWEEFRGHAHRLLRSQPSTPPPYNDKQAYHRKIESLPSLSLLPFFIPIYRLLAPFSSSPVYMFNNNESAERYTFCPDADTTFAMSLAASILRSLINAGFSRMAFPTRAAD